MAPLRLRLLRLLLAICKGVQYTSDVLPQVCIIQDHDKATLAHLRLQRHPLMSSSTLFALDQSRVSASFRNDFAFLFPSWTARPPLLSTPMLR